MRIAAGPLYGQGVGDLARELGVSERQLRRAMERELGVSPIELALTHRLLLAKCLLTDTRLSVTRVAYASGFQSLRRFNSVFRQRYRMSPSVLRRRPRRSVPDALPSGPAGDWVRLMLGYRPPLAWDALLATIAGDTPPRVGRVNGFSYARTVSLEGRRGVVFVSADGRGPHISVNLSVSLLPALMPLLARLRHLLDLDAEPAVIERHLADSGLALHVRRCPGLRLAGAFDGFEVAARDVLGCDLLGRVTDALGEPFDTEVPDLDRLPLAPDRVATAGVPFLSQLGVPEGQALALVSLAEHMAHARLRLEPGSDVPSTLRALHQIPGIDARTAATIAMRALHWPDAFPSTDRSLQQAAGVPNAPELLRIAERWRPWRAYAAAQLSR
jgi:AraC family transcriptional regulator of adaptative response / DNA-3-methyladenine glycosylase II